MAILKQNKTIIALCLSLLLIAGVVVFTASKNAGYESILSYTVEPKTQDLQLYWKDDNGNILKNITNLKAFIESKNKTLTFAMNAGMYMQDNTPLGLYIENGKILKQINRASANGNFYLKPNGIFYITTDNIPFVVKTEDFKNNGNIKYATQSGPMLVIDGQIHPAFKESSSNLNIRNGVGILPNNKVVFAMSKKNINFYDFAKYFQNLGCQNALFLDGFVSRTYLPEKKWTQTDGNFGVMIGVTEKR
ncbi:MAG: phosphodiester glycosidase family protein [Chitinophagales bacterium]|nr:phosphodiester glycosidase family protein [Chitinophagales bacterium]